MLRTDTENASTRPSLSPNGLQARIAARIGTVTKSFSPKRPGSASAIHFSSAANYNVIFKTIDDSIMLTFQQFLQDTAEKGRTINTLFEERLFALVGTLERTAGPLAAAKIPYEVIGGMAVMVQIDRVEPAAVRNTKDIDIMINRADLERIGKIALIDGDTSKALNAVHLVFSSEKTKANQTVPNPPLRPEHVSAHGVPVAVIPVLDLVMMKLANNRDIDRVHVRDLDSVGLITPEIEKALTAPLHARLQGIRSSE